MLVDFLTNLKLKIQRLQFTPKKQQALLEDLANLLEDGVSVNQALKLMEGFATSHLDLEVLRQMQLKMSEGEPFVLGLVGWCQNNLIDIILAGEEGGTLVDSIRMAANTVQDQNAGMDAFIQGLIYPGTMLIAGLAMMVYIGSTVFPRFISIKPSSEWPAIGQQALAFATFIKDFWWLVIIIIAAIVFTVNYILKNYVGEFRETFDKFIPFSIYRQIVGAHFMETLGLLIRNGVPLKQCLRITQKNAQPYFFSHLVLMEYRLSGGRDNIADVLDTGIIDQQDLARLRVIAVGKGFEEALIRQGKRSMARALQTNTLTGKVLGGMCMGTTASLLGFIFYAIYSIGTSLANQ